jgi:uncharacterized membrane protein YkvA (DUF1232 family)
VLRALKRWAFGLKREALTVWLIARDPRTPWIVKALALGVAAYAFSPIDLIPDFIPVLGLLDDLILLPVGVWLVLRLTPAEIRTYAHQEAQRRLATLKPLSRAAVVAIVVVWLAALIALAEWLL